jgi:hypothetical protein
MKRFALLAFLAGVTLTAGCVTTGTGSTAPSKPNLTPAQVMQIACPPIQTAIVQFQALDATLLLTNPADEKALKAQALLAQAQPIVAAACAAGAAVDVSSVTAFAESVLPIVAQAAGTLPLKPDQLAQVQAGLLAAQVAIGVVNVVESSIATAQAQAVK